MVEHARRSVATEACLAAGALGARPRRVAHFPKGRGELCEGEERGAAQHRAADLKKSRENPELVCARGARVP